MPTNRRRRTRGRTRLDVPEIVLCALREGREAAARQHPDQALTLYDPGVLEQSWPVVREQVLEQWVAAHPGTRPDGWWTFDAPEPRRRLGGSGTPSHEVLNCTVTLVKGIPAYWIDADDVEVFGALRAKDRRPPFDGVAVDAGDPPRFESEAAYLDRHPRLFLPGERPRVPAAAWRDARVLP